MRFFISIIVKLALIAGIVLFGLVNYRAYSFDNGWSTVEVNKMSTQTVISRLTSIQKVEYYKNTIANGYKIFVSTNDENYLLDATEDDINAIRALSILSNSKPQKITPIPFYIEIIAGIIILAIPFGRRRKRQVVLDEDD